MGFSKNHAGNIESQCRKQMKLCSYLMQHIKKLFYMDLRFGKCKATVLLQNVVAEEFLKPLDRERFFNKTHKVETQRKRFTNLFT